MSHFQSCLELFGFSTPDQLTIKSLKSAFKRIVLKSHPDKGGKADEFDQILSGFTYLTDILKKLNGGRELREMITAPYEIEERRANEWISEMFDEMVKDSDTELFGKMFKEDIELPKDFHQSFEESYKEQRIHGYDSWLNEDVSQVKKNTPNTDVESIKSERGYGYENEIKEHIIPTNDFNTSFESTMIHRKPEKDIVLFPDEMAHNFSGCKGALLIHNSESYTSESGLKPQQHDLYKAYTSDNTIFDKVPQYNTRLNPNNPDDMEKFYKERAEFDELIRTEQKEQTEHDNPYNDPVVAEYEQRKFEKEKEHMAHVRQYFSDDKIDLNKSIEHCIARPTLKAK
jgi:hypothetical protein